MDAEVKAKQLREYERILQVIDDCISSRDDHYERNKAILKEILEDVFATIKGRNGFFREQLQGFFFVEKYYKGLTVIKPEEFDVNIIVEIPLYYCYITLTEVKPGYKQVEFPYDSSIYTSRWAKYRKFMSNWLGTSNYGYYIDSDAFRQSMESLLESAMLNVPKIDNYTIKVRKNGLAFTQVCVNKQGFPEMNVNLVPVLELDSRLLGSLAKEGFKWYAVPDPLKDVTKQLPQWRMALEDHENDLLTRHSYLMPFIRQLEKLRDTQEWKVISYYHIKTLIMNYARSIENFSGLPDTFKLTGIKLLIHILDQLRNMCKTHHLENVWVPEHNLIDTDESQFADIAELLTTMINEIIDDPAKVADWILTPEELSMYANALKDVGIIQGTDCPSNNLQMSEDDKPGSSDVLNMADDIVKPVTNATVSSGGSESSLSNEGGKDTAGCLEELNRIVVGLRDSIDMLSRRLTALEQKSTETA